jgi:hypothetical protein
MGDGAAAGTRIAANGRGQLIQARAARQTKGHPAAVTWRDFFCPCRSRLMHRFLP